MIGLCVLVAAFGRVGVVGTSLVAVGLLLIAPSVHWLALRLRRGDAEQTVDSQIWPFRREADLETQHHEEIIKQGN